MHLGNGAITPECAMLTASVAAAGLGFAAASIRRSTSEKQPWLMAGALGAAVFAAQMINFPVLPYASGHLVGGVLLAVMLRPGLGALTMAVILALQALLLGDGGIAALGANIINMALLPASVVALGSAQRSALIAGAQAGIVTLVAAALVVLEVALARNDLSEMPLARFAREMVAAHAAIGVIEGLLTYAIVLSLSHVTSTTRQAAVLGMAAIALLAVLPLASGMPDGYEAAAERSAWHSLLTDAPEALPGPNATLASWQATASTSVSSLLPGDYLTGIAATLLAGASCTAAAWICLRRASVTG